MPRARSSEFIRQMDIIPIFLSAHSGILLQKIRRLPAEYYGKLTENIREIADKTYDGYRS
jgi:hypothetical protein